MKKFLNVLLVVILLAVIGGGIGYIGYTSLFTNHAGHNMSTSTSTTQTTDTTADTSTDSANTSMNMSQNSGTSNTIGLAQSNIVLQNKESLDITIATLNEALKLMTVDPYASNIIVPPSQIPNTQNNVTTPNAQAPEVQGGTGTTINIYPQGSNSGYTPQNTMQPSTVMQNMGTTYDATKMEQLHNGLFKISVGMAMLDQVETQLVSQAQNASANTQDPVQYYINQYNLTIENKNKLNQALTNINEASNLININPYVSSNGLVYDKDRMTQVHQSVFKLAQGVVSLNVLNDEFTKETISLSNTVQNYINSSSISSMNMSQTSGLLGGLFDNVSTTSVINIVLILFVVGLILGILGFIFSLFKPQPQPDTVINNRTVPFESGV